MNESRGSHTVTPVDLTSLPFPCQTQGLLVTGGFKLSSIEVWIPGGVEPPCTLPPLPSPRIDHTVSVVNGRIVTCGGWDFSTNKRIGFCMELTLEGWTNLTGTLETRRSHASVVIQGEILLIGGWGNSISETTEIVSVTEGQSRQSFPLTYPRHKSCTIQLSPSSLVITGGSDAIARNKVVQYDGVGGDNPTPSELPRLNTGRYRHACGVYEKEGSQVLLVTGGSGVNLASTEVYSYSSGVSGVWRTVEAILPHAITGAKAANMNGKIFLAGGTPSGNNYLDSVLTWDITEEKWIQEGRMNETRAYHTVTPVELTSLPCQTIN